MEQYPMYSFATLILILLVLANTGILLIVTEFIFKYLFMLF